MTYVRDMQDVFAQEAERHLVRLVIELRLALRRAYWSREHLMVIKGLPVCATPVIAFERRQAASTW